MSAEIPKGVLMAVVIHLHPKYHAIDLAVWEQTKSTAFDGVKEYIIAYTNTVSEEKHEHSQPVLPEMGRIQTNL